jgi:hypothetical protein
MGVKTDLYQFSAGYRGLSRYFFFGLVIVGLLGTATGAFAQSAGQSQLTLVVTNVGFVASQPSCGHPGCPRA